MSYAYGLYESELDSLWYDKIRPYEFNLSVFAADGFSGVVSWAGIEWRLPDDNGRVVKKTMRVGRCGFSFSPEHFPSLLIGQENEVIYAMAPTNVEYSMLEPSSEPTSIYHGVKTMDGNMGFVVDDHGNKYCWESLVDFNSWFTEEYESRD
jgi:hypothetical protein